MSAVKGSVVFFLAVLAIVNCLRLRRSPDSVQMDFPDYTTASPEDNQLNEEGEYWQGEGDRTNERYEEDRDNRNKTAQKNQEDLEKERDYRDEQQDNNNKEAQDNYDKNHEKMDDRQKEQEDHYNNEHSDTDYDRTNQQNNDDFNKEAQDKGDRYNDKGQDGMNDMQDYEAESPTVSYNRS